MNRRLLTATTAVLAAVLTLAIEHVVFQPVPAAGQEDQAAQDEPAAPDEAANSQDEPAPQDESPPPDDEAAPQDDEPTPQDDEPASEPGEIQLTEETLQAMEAALAEVARVQRTLEAQGLYQPAVDTINSFAVTVGGSRAIDDLEAGRGVDPETFAALYAGFATPEVAEHLTTDEEGRLLYKGRLIMMYPRSRLEQLFRDRSAMAEDVEP